MIPETAKRYYRVKEAAIYTGIPVGTLYQMVHWRQIPHIKVGRKVLFDRQELDEFMAKRRVDTNPGKKVIASIIADVLQSPSRRA